MVPHLNVNQSEQATDTAVICILTDGSHQSATVVHETPCLSNFTAEKESPDSGYKSLAAGRVGSKHHDNQSAPPGQGVTQDLKSPSNRPKSRHMYPIPTSRGWKRKLKFNFKSKSNNNSQSNHPSGSTPFPGPASLVPRKRLRGLPVSRPMEPTSSQLPGIKKFIHPPSPSSSFDRSSLAIHVPVFAYLPYNTNTYTDFDHRITVRTDLSRPGILIVSLTYVTNPTTCPPPSRGGLNARLWSTSGNRVLQRGVGRKTFPLNETEADRMLLGKGERGGTGWLFGGYYGWKKFHQQNVAYTERVPWAGLTDRGTGRRLTQGKTNNMHQARKERALGLLKESNEGELPNDLYRPGELRKSTKFRLRHEEFPRLAMGAKQECKTWEVKVSAERWCLDRWKVVEDRHTPDRRLRVVVWLQELEGWAASQFSEINSNGKRHQVQEPLQRQDLKWGLRKRSKRLDITEEDLLEIEDENLGAEWEDWESQREKVTRRQLSTKWYW